MNYTPKLSQMILLLTALTTFAASTIKAQQPTLLAGQEMRLQPSQYKLSRLAPNITSDTATFMVDNANTVTVEIISTSDAINTSITSPTGQVIDPNTVNGIGGSFIAFTAGTQEASPVLLPSTTPGAHYIYVFPLQGSGTYTVRFQAAANPTTEVPIITQVMTDSTIAATLFATESVLLLGNRAVLTAAVFDGQTGLKGATVNVFVKPATGSQMSLTLRDDGVAPDNAQGDGLYSAEFAPSVAERYTALAQITGTTASGAPYSRQATAEWVVVPRPAILTGVVQEQGINDDANPLFDRVAVDIQTNTSTAGHYRATVHLKTAQGQKLVRSAEADLSTGLGNIRVNFEASAFFLLGENGPYVIDLVELEVVSSAASTLSDERANLGATRAYQLSQFQRPPISLTNQNSATGIDSNGNGKFDILRIQVGVNVTQAGTYQFSGALADSLGREIDFFSGSATFVAGNNTITFNFNGAKIGQSGMNGPYVLRSILLFGGGTSLVANTLFTTQAFSVRQFESSTEADVVLSGTATPGPLLLGANITYALTVVNNGPRAVTGITLTDTLPAGVSFVSATPSSGNCAQAGGVITCTLGDLNSGGKITINVIVTTTQPGAVNTTPRIAANESDPEPGNNTVSLNVSVLPATPIFQFSVAAISINEGAGRATITVNRGGNTLGAASVDYYTSDNDTFTVSCADNTNNQSGAYARCDFATVIGRLDFAAGELEKTFVVPIIDDAHAETAETFSVVLSNPAGTSLGAISKINIAIQDDDAAGAANPVTTSHPFFVRQQYLDFLSREPDTNGFNAWLGVLNGCADSNTAPDVPSGCDRIYVSGEGFFRSVEFQLKGAYVFRFYKLAFNRLPEYTEIISDMSFVAGQTPEEVFARKAQLSTLFTQRAEFQTLYGGMTNAQYVSALLGRYGLTQVLTSDPANPDGASKVTLAAADLTNRLDAGQLSRAQVLRAVADSDEVGVREFNNAFVGMQYYGYLRRKPEQSGFEAWLRVLQSGDVRTMVNGFLNSTEYKLRFGKVQ